MNKNINVNVSDPLLSRSVAEEIAAMNDEEEASRSERDAPKEQTVSEPSSSSTKTNPATTSNNPTVSESVIKVEVHPQPSTGSTAGAEALPASTFGN